MELPPRNGRKTRADILSIGYKSLLSVAFPHPHLTPLWRESRFGLEWAGLRRSDIFRGTGMAPGEGRGVMLIPGFLAGDGSLGTMTQWLRAAGYRTKRAGIRSNVACSEVACQRLEERLESLAGRDRRARRDHRSEPRRRDRQGARRPPARPRLGRRRARLAGALAARRSIPSCWRRSACVAALGSGPVPGLISWRCLRGECCSRFRADVAGPLPPGVGYVAIYSRSDGIVDWRSCIDPYADECAEVRASHCGMGVNAGAYRVIARALGELQAADDGLAEAA